MNKTTDLLFRLGLYTKGIDSLFEVIGGLLLTMPTRLSRYILVLSQHELYRHHQVLSGRLDRLAESVLVHAHLASALYLFVHGLSKVILISAIFKGKRWGYTGLMGVLSLFAVIELTRAVTAHELVTGILGIFDGIVIFLIYKEFRARFGSEGLNTDPKDA